MSTGPVTVGTDTMRVTSTNESAEDMIAALTPKDDKAKTLRVLTADGKSVKEAKPETEEEPDETSRAASVLGKKGGEAAAMARRKAENEQAKAAKEAPAKEAKPEGKAADAEVDEGKDETTEGEEKPLGKPRSDPRARIAVLARERDEAKAKAAELEKQLSEGRRRDPDEARRNPPPRESPASSPRQERSADPEDVEPTLKQFLAKDPDYDNAVEAFAKAHGEWRDKRRHHEDSQREAARVYTETIDSHARTFRERVSGHPHGHAEQDGSYKEFMSSLPDAVVSKLVPSFMLPQGAKAGPANLTTDLIFKSEKPRELLEYFGDNPDEFQRIATLRTPPEIWEAMAIIKYRLDAATTDISSKREVSRAGTPAKSVAGSPHTDTGELGDDAPLSAFAKRFREREFKASHR